MTTCDTRIRYNGVTLYGVLTENVDIKPVFDSAGVNFIGMRTTITCIAYLHASGYARPEHGTLASTLGESNLGPALRVLAQQVIQPRRQFIMTIDNYTMFNILPAATEPGLCNPTASPTSPTLNVDIEHGPKSEMQILSIQGTKSARCRFTFSFVTPVCDNWTSIKDFVSLRFWIADDVDCTTWLTRRTYKGVFRVKGLNVDPHVLARHITIPPLQKGFRRDSITWHQDQDGLHFHFSIVDVEQWAMAPKPATYFRGTFSLSIPQADITHTSELRFTLRGAKEKNWYGDEKLALMKLAQNIIDRKLHYVEQAAETDVIVEAQNWTETLEDAEISVYMRIRHTGELSLTGNLMQIGQWFEFGKPLGATVSWFENDQNVGSRDYDKDTAYIPEHGPSAGLKGIFLAALTTPCCVQTVPSGETEEEDEEEEPETNQPREQEEPPTNQPRITYDNTIRYAEHHRKAPYLSYVMSADYDRDTGYRAFPTGAKCGTGDSDSTFAFAQLHCNVSTMELRIEATRANKWPVIPDMRDSWTDENTKIKYVLKKANISPAPPQVCADGKHDVRSVYAHYVYYMSRPLQANEYYQSGNLPYVDLTKEVAFLDDNDIQKIPPEAFVNPNRIIGNEMQPFTEFYGDDNYGPRYT